MDITITSQTYLFFTSILLGASLAAVYDIFRILRIAIPSGSLLIAIEDIFYFLFCTFVTFTFILRTNEGMVRSYILLGEIIGWVLYYLTLGNLVISFSRKIILFFEKLFLFVYRYFIRPVYLIIRWFLRLFKKPVLWLYKQGKKVNTNNKYNLKQIHVMLYNLFVKK